MNMNKNKGIAFSKWAGEMFHKLPYKYLRKCYEEDMTLEAAVNRYEGRHENSN